MDRRRRIEETFPASSSQAEQQKKHFFIQISKECLEKRELEIPEEFTRNLPDEIPELVAVFKNPFGKEWPVGINKVDGSVSFRNGLLEFFEYNYISAGDLVVFRSDGNLTFSVFIFGQSACEIDYPTDPEEHLHPSRMKSKKPRVDSPTEKPSFEVTMNERAVGKPFILTIPKDFAHKHLEKGHQKIKLSISDDTEWDVKCIVYDTHAILSAGWLGFSRDNELQVGDHCVFELSDVASLHFNVHISHVAEIANPANK